MRTRTGKLVASAAALLGLTACGQSRAPELEGPRESAARQLLLSTAPVQQRFAGLFEYFSRGFVEHVIPTGSQVRFPGAPSVNGRSADDLDGFARTGSLLAAWVYSQREGHARWAQMLRAGILSGVDPHSSGYWGNVGEYDQRIVEATDIARILWLTRTEIWDQLSREQRQMISNWLLTAATRRTPPDNWMLFPVVISVVLVHLNAEVPATDLLAKARAQFTDYKRYYLDHGWFTDPPNGVDFYNTWGIPYDLFWIHWVDPTFEPDFIVTALRQSAELTQHLISPQGIAIMGRSICYRTAVPVPLLAANLMGTEQFSSGRAVRGLDVVWRYFVAHDSLRGGALTQGYFGTDLRWLDRYSGAGSCHWGLRSLVLAFMHPANDPFWSAVEEPLPVEVADYRLELPRLGWIVEGRHETGEITITIPKNPVDIVAAEPYSWIRRAQDTFSRRPHRPSNHEIKYESRHYSSATPFPVQD
jgi:hypothetical protein